ncbi:MAG: hypothetical protein QOJ56_3647 [Mycobacterium sp.]|nr:hypothetical protein [Mycobacterium sp.]
MSRIRFPRARFAAGAPIAQLAEAADLKSAFVGVSGVCSRWDVREKVTQVADMALVALVNAEEVRTYCGIRCGTDRSARATSSASRWGVAR